jgi:signal transduction protein with GAF and PtsI domain
VEDRIHNYDDAPSSIYYEKIRENPEYHGLLLVPVKLRTDGDVLGVLSIDRQKKEAFDSNAENVAWSLSHLLAYAVSTASEFRLSEEGEKKDEPPISLAP